MLTVFQCSIAVALAPATFGNIPVISLCESLLCEKF